MLFKVFIVTWCLFFHFDFSSGTCFETSLVQKYMPQKYPKTYIQTYNTTCLFYRSRCVKTKIGSYMDTRYVLRAVIEQKCCSGYVMVESNNSSTSKQCKPVCLPNCKNGDCIAPGTCVCKPGYREENGNARICLPSCDNCVHGTCFAPNVCNCSFGYSLQNGTCQAICTEPCHNGSCVAPDTCECLYGFRKTETNTCSPYCSRGCSHGTCTGPETCTCDEGFVNTSPEECVPFCEKNCGNGTCTAPNTCQCESGYKVGNSTPVCEPRCDTECGHGKCVAPNFCQCDPGYIFDEHNASRCVPNCDIPCGNGTCIAPNTCVCFSGYSLDMLSSPRCKPNCETACGNGTCVAPNVCKCTKGFKVSNVKPAICVPDCGNCEGICKEPDKCICEEPLKIKRLTIDGRECTDDDIKKCKRTVCVIDDPENMKNVSYGYDDFSANDSTTMKIFAINGQESSNNSEYYYEMYDDDNIYNDIQVEHSPIEINVATQPEHWMHSKWAYAIIAVGIIIVAIILGSIAIYWKTIASLCSGGGSYPVEDDLNEDATGQDQEKEMRMSSILKKRQADPS